MARKPARLERAGALTPRDRMWAAMRALSRSQSGETNESFSPAEVMVLTQLHVDTVCTYFRGLAKAHPPYLQLVNAHRPSGARRRECFRYALIRDVGVDAPTVTALGKPTEAGRGVQRIWTALKALKEFDCSELSTVTTTNEHPVSVATVKAYVRYLARAGYVVLTAPSKPGMQARYRFLPSKNTGPRAPLLCRDKSVLDANTGTVVYQRDRR